MSKRRPGDTRLPARLQHVSDRSRGHLQQLPGWIYEHEAEYIEAENAIRKGKVLRWKGRSTVQAEPQSLLAGSVHWAMGGWAEQTG
ncbi:MAG: hypothetical protein R2856_15535 [Caldilineaceae bacterium]